MSRPISQQEAKLLERVLAVGAHEPPFHGAVASIPTLKVTATCKCGCSTIWFGPDGDATIGHNLAEALATLGGETVTLIVWSQGEAVVGLEILGQERTGLPSPLSVRSYGDA
jgi:hypothetical protein